MNYSILRLTVLLALSLPIMMGLSPLSAQEIRTIDGRGNNPDFPEWGASHTNFIRLAQPAYPDSMSAIAGMDRMNPREISNFIFAQEGLINDRLALSDYVWVFGQFIDHDVVLSENELTEPLIIPVPQGDPWMDPMGQGMAIIPIFRNRFDPATGTAPGNPRQHINEITAFIDGSAVYGSDSDREAWLRSYVDGKLKVSEGNLLPYNTLTGNFNDPRDPLAPFMGDDVGTSNRLFVAGDVRANENPLLIAFHTLFVREHNRLCDEYKELHPEWDDERLYQKARKMVGAHIQSVVYDEWLPAMGIELEPYRGYDRSVDPSLSNVFAAAAFRLGHTLLNSQIMRLDGEGDVIPRGHIGLRDAFFQPTEVPLAGGLDPYFKGMGVQIQQNLDCKIIDDVRNFLFGIPGLGGLDLASINIMRGRERGLPDFNTLRASIGLPKYEDLSQICSDPELTGGLNAAYNGDVNNVDPWVGMLAEDHMPEALFGETIMEIMKDQFTRLRDGDRFYYENDEGISVDEIDRVKNTRLSDIIRRNTNIKLMQDNVFVAMEHDEIPFARAEVTRTNLDIALFPNPVVDQLNIKLYASGFGESTVNIFDMQGRLVASQDIDLVQGINTFSVDASPLTGGVFVLQVGQNGEYNSVRFVKQQ